MVDMYGQRNKQVVPLEGVREASVPTSIRWILPFPKSAPGEPCRLTGEVGGLACRASSGRFTRTLHNEVEGHTDRMFREDMPQAFITLP